MIHIDEVHKYYFDKKSKLPQLYRIGYQINDPRESIKKNYDQDIYESNKKLGLMHEAIVQKMSKDIIQKNADKFIEELELSPEETNKSYGYNLYDCMIDIMDRAAAEIAKKKGESPDAVWKRLKRGLFTGEMMHLRDLEKYVDQGLLNKLARLKSLADMDRKLPKKLTESEIEIDGKKYKVKYGGVYATD